MYQCCVHLQESELYGHILEEFSILAHSDSLKRNVLQVIKLCRHW